MKGLCEGLLCGLMTAGAYGVANEMSDGKTGLFWIVFLFAFGIGFACLKVVGSKNID